MEMGGMEEEGCNGRGGGVLGLMGGEEGLKEGRGEGEGSSD